MKIAEMSVPRPVAGLLPRRFVYTRSYPTLPDRSFGGSVNLRIAVWLAESGWPMGDGHASPLCVAARLLFQRWRFEADFLERGGRL